MGSGSIAAVRAAFNAMRELTLGDGVTGTMNMGIYSRKLSEGQSAPIVTPVTGVVVRATMGSQRRRQAVE